MKVPKFLTDRRSYLNQFQRTAAGEYIYTGKTYAYSDTVRSRRQTLARYWTPAAVMLATAVGQGCIPASGMRNCVYVLLPFLISLLCAISAVWALVKLSTSKEPLREYVYTSTVPVLPVRSMFAAIFAGATFLGECIFVLIHGTDDLIRILMLLVLILADFCASMLLHRRTKRKMWQLCQNNSE